MKFVTPDKRSHILAITTGSSRGSDQLEKVLGIISLSMDMWNSG